MTLVPNHLRQLNGSRILVLLCCLTILACDPLKQVPKDPEEPVVVEPQRPAVDTLEMDVVENPIPPVIETIDTLAINSGSEIVRKDRYSGVIFLPFNADGAEYINNISGAKELTLHYYAGILEALETLEADSLLLDLTVLDSRRPDAMEQLMGMEKDFVLGGNTRSEIESLANHALEDGSYFFSPWYPGNGFISENPFYVQLNPSLEAHLIRVLDHSLRSYTPEQIHIVGSRQEENRMTLINDLYMEMYAEQGAEPLDTMLISDLSQFIEMDVSWILEADDPVVFIIPATRNVYLIHDFFRMLNTAGIRDQVVVYGITSWNNDILYPFMNAFDVRVTSADWPDLRHSDNDFVQSFYEVTNTYPMARAYEGFNHMSYIGACLREFGLSLNQQKEGPFWDDNNGRIHIVDRRNLMTTEDGSEQSNSADYFENTSLYLLKFSDFRYDRFEEND